jgi:predicted metal-dependent peptidase
MDTKNQFDLNLHMARLLMDEPFFAAVSRRVDKRAHSGIPTAGVRVNPDTSQFEMFYNPEFFAGLTDDERRDVLKHEFYHIVFLHVTDRMPAEVDGDQKKAKLWNIATDLAINSNLHHLPEGCCKPGVPDTPFAELPSGMSAEWYLKNMPPMPKKKQGEGEGEGSGSAGEPGEGEYDSFDDHSGWGEVSEEQREIAKERLKSIIKNAAEESSRANSWGTVPASCREEIMKGIKSVLDWKKVLRYFIKTSQKANRKSSIRRINRRYPYIHAGKKSDRVARVAISIDQSGSVSNSMLAAFFTELNKLSEIAEFTVVPFDTVVNEEKVFNWKKGENRKWERVSCGGTCFDAPTKWVNKRSFDGHIILTDLMAPKPVSSKAQRMWITTEYYAQRPYFTTNERVIAIPDRDM